MLVLLAHLGMRVGEVVRLDRDDVDLIDGLVTIRNPKFGKSRQIPLHPTSTTALAGYARRCDERGPVPKRSAFFT